MTNYFDANGHVLSVHLLVFDLERQRWGHITRVGECRAIDEDGFTVPACRFREVGEYGTEVIPHARLATNPEDWQAWDTRRPGELTSTKDLISSGVTITQEET
jgi:hypothetical protein